MAVHGRETARLTLRIPATAFERLKAVAAALDVSKTACAEELLECAVDEAFEQLNLFCRLSTEELDACGFTPTQAEALGRPIPGPLVGESVFQAREGSEVA